MTEYAIETKGLTVYYGRHRGIIDVDLRVEKGEIFGFLGPNGAGKTTTERVLLDIIRPTAGSASMLGLDCQKEGVQARAKVGYLPGELSFYDNMKASQFFQMYHSLQGNGTDTTYWQSLADRLDLDTSRKIRDFSRGNKQKVGIVLAFMNKPALLILDEPTSGLDPLVQQTVLDMIREGRLVATERIEDLMRQQLKRLRLSFSSMPPVGAFGQDGVTEIERDGQTVLLEVRDNLNAVLETAVNYQITNIETESVSLEEVFLAYYFFQKRNLTVGEWPWRKAKIA